MIGPLYDQLVLPDEGGEMNADDRPITHQYHAPMRSRRFNQYYDTLRVANSLNVVADTAIYGSQSVTNGTTQRIPLVTPTSFNARLVQWPDAVSAHLTILHFSIAPTVTTGTGVIQASWETLNGSTIALGDYVASVQGGIQLRRTDPIPFTDPSPPGLGTLILNYIGGAAAITFSYSLQFGISYLLGATEPYDNGS